MSRRRRVGVVGCGDVSVVHLEAIAELPEAKLAAVCDVDGDRARAVGELLGVAWYTDHRMLLARARPDVVHVCTPHDAHADVAVDAVAAGVPVLVEKPLAHTLSAGERVAAAAREHPAVKVGLCLQNRYNVTSTAMHDRLVSGHLGEVLSTSSTVFWHRTPEYYRARPWRGQRYRAGGGVLMNQAIHTLDLVQWLGGEVVAVAGHVGRYGGTVDGGTDGDPDGDPHDVVDVEDTAALVLDHAGGVRSVLFATLANGIDSPVTLEIVAEGATLYLRDDLTVTYPDGRTEIVREPRVRRGGRAYWGASHARLIADFYARLDEPEPFWIGPEQGLQSLRVLNRVYADVDQRAGIT